MNAAAPLLDVRDLHVRYGVVPALRGVSLHVAPGEVVALIGANGAGKTTTLRAISALLPATAGSVYFDGAEVTRARPHTLAARGLAHAPEGRGIFTQLTVRENLALGAWTRRDDAVAADRERAFALFPILRDRHDQVASTLSGGEQQMLAIARALLQRPRLLLLDEPSLGLAPRFVERIFAVIAEINAGGVAILLVEQNAAMALAAAHRAYVLESGEITMTGSGAALLQSPEVRRAYLGE